MVKGCPESLASVTGDRWSRRERAGLKIKMAADCANCGTLETLMARVELNLWSLMRNQFSANEFLAAKNSTKNRLTATDSSYLFLGVWGFSALHAQTGKGKWTERDLWSTILK